MKVPRDGVEAVHRAGPPAMHELLVVVQVEAVEVDALAAFDLLDAQDLALEELHRLAGAGLHHPFPDFVAGAHRLASLPVSAAR